ncbi:helix-turn-helix transcriptional regulator [Herminiimonas glaciei]|uniref:Helix-turn-helix transcriptional regulator n=1 Tax=Herminiimonas glaciei TaxID=523788 RepID=A0ABW2I7B6_9BURK
MQTIQPRSSSVCHKRLNTDIPFWEDVSPTKGCRKTLLSVRQIRNLNTYIDERMATRIRTMDLAADLGLSVSHFSRIFKQTTGTSPRIYILRRRIAGACATMLLSDLHLTDIAYMYGFCDQSHFNRAFNFANGISPLEWRRVQRKVVSSFR